MKKDIAQEVNNQIIRQIEAGADDWEMPWIRTARNAMPMNATTGNDYSGANILMLWAQAGARGFATDQWATYKQWQSIGAQVRGGETGSQIIKVGEYIRDSQHQVDEHGNPLQLTGRYMKAYAVFNADQVDGYDVGRPDLPALAQRIAHADAYVAATGADIRETGERAFYAHAPRDFIQVPPAAAFTATAGAAATENFYSTVLHELTHWTGDERRCPRTKGKRFGDNAYAFEELVAELGAAFLCCKLGITNTPRPDHAKYLTNWLDVLQADKFAIFAAAKLASQAAAYLDGLQAARPAQIAA